MPCAALALASVPPKRSRSAPRTQLALAPRLAEVTEKSQPEALGTFDLRVPGVSTVYLLVAGIDTDQGHPDQREDDITGELTGRNS